MGWEAVGWQLKARAGSPGIPGIDPYPPPSREQGCCAVGSWEPGPRAGEGPQVGEAVRTSVAFIHLAAPIRLAVTHPPSPRSLLRGPAQANLRARTPSWGLRVPCPRTCWGLGSSRSRFPDF